MFCNTFGLLTEYVLMVRYTFRELRRNARNARQGFFNVRIFGFRSFTIAPLEGRQTVKKKITETQHLTSHIPHHCFQFLTDFQGSTRFLYAFVLGRRWDADYI